MRRFPAPTIVVAGTMTLDTIERDGAVHRDVPGGSATYASVAASRLLPVHVVGIVGTDFPVDVLASRDACPVDTSDVEVREGPTFRWHARYDAGGDTRTTVSRDRGVAEGRLPRVHPPVPPFALLLGSMDPRAQQHVLDACRGATLVGLDSMAYWWAERGDEVRAMLPRIDVLFVDEEELALATRATDASQGVASLLAMGPSLVVVKRGSRGAWLQRRGTAPISTSAWAVPTVVDPTGAGDAMAGALIAALASTATPDDQRSLHLATALAGAATEGLGVAGLARTDDAEMRARARGLAAATPAPPR